MAEVRERIAVVRAYQEVAELSGEAVRAFNSIRATIPKDDLDFITSGNLADTILKEIKIDKLALLLGRYEYHVFDHESPERALVKAMLLKESFEQKGLRVEIGDPQPEEPGLRRRIFFRTIVISGWKANLTPVRYSPSQQVPEEDEQMVIRE